jgi:superfamily I DNA and/or RNA helicase
MPPGALEILRRVNDYLRSALVRLHPERRHCSTLQLADFSELLGQVLQATECLRTHHPAVPSTSSESDPLVKDLLKDGLLKNELLEKEALVREALEYRGHLEDLKRTLPDLHVRLLAERQRLEAARSHLAAAASWAGASKETI